MKKHITFFKEIFLKFFPIKKFFSIGISLLYISSFNIPMVHAKEISKGNAILKDIWVHGNRISIKANKKASFNIFRVHSPNSLVVEMTNTENAWNKRELTLKDNKLFSKIKSSQYQNRPSKVARVTIQLNGPIEYETERQGNVIQLQIRADDQKQATSHKLSPSKKISSIVPIAAGPTPVEAIRTTQTSEPFEQPTQKLAKADPTPYESEEQSKYYVSKPNSSSSRTTSKKRKRKKSIKRVARDANPSAMFGKQPVTLDFYDIPIRDLFKILADKAGINVVYGNDVLGSISIQLKNVSFSQAVDTILALQNLRMVVMGENIVQLLTPTEFDKYKTSAISLTKIFPINYAKAVDVDTQLKSILTTLGGKGQTLIDERTNSIIVTDTPEGIEATGNLIIDLDKPAPQVTIEAKIVQVSLGSSLDLGITWGIAYTDQQGGQMITIGAAEIQPGVNDSDVATGGSGAVGLQSRTALNPSGSSGLENTGTGFSGGQGLGLSFGFVKDVVRLNAALSALQTKNKSKLLSNPKIATLNNQAASIKSEVSEPFITTETQLTNAGTLTSQVVNQSISGISLEVTPTINADGRITMKIVPDITSSQPTAIGVPRTTSQQANTTVIVKNGETFVIGGLISEQKSDDKTHVPFLGRIPLVGNFFKRTSKTKNRTELLIFVTPRIIPY